MRFRRAVGLTVLMTVFGLLLWAKLLLVTSYPRTAIADPVPGPSTALAQTTDAR